MANIRLLLKEELLLNDKKSLLSPESLVLINNPNHVKYVLGIDVALNEHLSFDTRKRIIEEQIIVENILDSMNKYLGISDKLEKGKQYAIDVVNTIGGVKDVVKLFKDLILEPEFMGSAVNALSQKCKELANSVKEKLTNILKIFGENVAGFSEKIKGLLEHVINYLSELSQKTGWGGFLAMLGFGTLVRIIDTTVLDKIINLGVNGLKQSMGFLGPMGELLTNFKEFALNIIASLDIKPIIDWLFTQSVEGVASSLFAGINILSIIIALLTPVMKSINWAKKLQKGDISLKRKK